VVEGVRGLVREGGVEGVEAVRDAADELHEDGLRQGRDGLHVRPADGVHHAHVLDRDLGVRLRRGGERGGGGEGGNGKEVSLGWLGPVCPFSPLHCAAHSHAP
jgi:hypothetical protein